MRLAHCVRGAGLLLQSAASPLCNLLLPPRCTLCDGDLSMSSIRALLCPDCVKGMVDPDAVRCARCAEHLPVDGFAGCAACRDRLPEFDSAWALGDYSAGLRTAVLRMKQTAGEPLAAAIAELLYAAAGDRIRSWRPDALLPAPMHWFRRLLRGANSAEVLSSHLARRLNLPHAAGCVVRHRHTMPQSGLTPGARLRNVRGAFRLRRGINLRGARILLVDDILTTGATCNEIARLLIRSGASATAVVVAARAAGKQ